MLMSFDTVSAEGSGTLDDPYNGTITTYGNFRSYDIVNHYFYVGTTFVYERPVGPPEPNTGTQYVISPGFGLTIDEFEGIISGTISQSGTIVIDEYDLLGGEKINQYTFYAVEPSTELVFESDPTSGDIVYVGS